VYVNVNQERAEISLRSHVQSVVLYKKHTIIARQLCQRKLVRVVDTTSEGLLCVKHGCRSTSSNRTTTRCLGRLPSRRTDSEHTNRPAKRVKAVESVNGRQAGSRRCHCLVSFCCD